MQDVGLFTDDHSYSPKFDFCALSDPACTYANVYTSMTYFPFANASGKSPVISGQTSYVFPFGNVTTNLYPDTFSLTIITMPDHDLCCGAVSMIVQPGMVVTPGRLVPGLAVQVTGAGTNSNLGWAYLNTLGSPFYWGQ